MPLSNTPAINCLFLSKTIRQTLLSNHQADTEYFLESLGNRLRQPGEAAGDSSSVNSRTRRMRRVESIKRVLPHCQ